ncbi:MAG: nicotinate (nicotinamide) nucleotide adenylyltransferase [Pyrinomonadaceae bacterium]|nr:nicotinate (nicotinamide) nucleotide adenylyltransferase [Pyrinomonadaceae bacterium]
MSGRNRIAIYGGTFDPVHLAHVEVAKRISQLFEIDKLLFVPAQVAPHKLNLPVTPAIHRYAMLVLATQQDPRLRVSTFELDAPDRRYTVDTLAHYKSEFGESADLFFVMGADSWSEITTWRGWERLLALVNHIVVTRPGYDINLDLVNSSVRERVVDLRGSTQIPKVVKEAAGEKIFITDAVMLANSATQIRRALREDDRSQLTRLVPSSVTDYIRKYELYRKSNEA